MEVFFAMVGVACIGGTIVWVGVVAFEAAADRIAARHERKMEQLEGVRVQQAEALAELRARYEGEMERSDREARLQAEHVQADYARKLKQAKECLMLEEWLCLPARNPRRSR